MRWTLAASALALAGCRDPYPSPAWTGAGATAPRRGGILRFAYDADVNTADPALAQDTVAAIPTRLIFDTLVGYGPGTTEIVPDLAERWEVSDDGRRYTFHLRADARFSNGRALTADDVRYSLERLLDAHRIASPGAENYRLLEGFDDYRSGRARALSGVQPVDPRTVVFRLAQRDPTFLHALAMRFAAPVPREVVEALGDARFGQEPVGTGPFVLVRWEKSTRMEFARNPYHHAAPSVHLDGVQFELSVPPHLQFMRFLAGDLDYLSNYGLATADWLWLRRNPAWLTHTHRAEVPLIGAFMMNTRMAPFDNVHVRRAVAGVDRPRGHRAHAQRAHPGGGGAVPLHHRGLPRAQPPRAALRPRGGAARDGPRGSPRGHRGALRPLDHQRRERVAPRAAHPGRPPPRRAAGAHTAGRAVGVLHRAGVSRRGAHGLRRLADGLSRPLELHRAQLPLARDPEREQLEPRVLREPGARRDARRGALRARPAAARGALRAGRRHRAARRALGLRLHPRGGERDAALRPRVGPPPGVERLGRRRVARPAAPARGDARARDLRAPGPLAALRLPWESLRP